MNILIGTLVLLALAGWVWTKLETDARRQEAIRGVIRMLKVNLPRLMIALVTAGLFAELLPEEFVRAYLGETSGLKGVLLGTVLGLLTPGGAFVSFALAAGSLAAGASDATMIAYLTSWALFSITKMMAEELAILGPQFIFARIAVSFPVPVIAGCLALLI